MFKIKYEYNKEDSEKLKELINKGEYEKFLKEVNKTKFTNKIQIDNSNII